MWLLTSSYSCVAKQLSGGAAAADASHYPPAPSPTAATSSVHVTGALMETADAARRAKRMERAAAL